MSTLSPMSVIEYQRTILGDSVRNQALASALEALVREGDVVIDVGSGTGLLAMLARRLGAEHCYLIEEDEDLARLAGEILRRNHVTGCTVVHAHSAKVRSLPKADLIISETLGNFAYEEGIIEGLRDARRFLKPGGRTMPQALEQWIAPVTSDRIWRELTSWERIGMDFDFTPARRRTLNNMYVKNVAVGDLWGRGKKVQVWDRIDFTRGDNSSQRRGSAEWKADGATTIFGFALWWECTLAPEVRLSTSPRAPATHWKQIYLPAAKPIELTSGDQLQIVIVSDTRPRVKVNVAWSVSRRQADGSLIGATQRLDMRKGR